jgi:hypothetical protein
MPMKERDEMNIGARSLAAEENKHKPFRSGRSFWPAHARLDSSGRLWTHFVACSFAYVANQSGAKMLSAVRRALGGCLTS